MPRLFALVTAIVVASALVISAAAAAPIGETESWGTFGTGDGQFANASLFGVDPVSGDVYTGDATALNKNGNRESWRIQKFSPTGTFEASVLIPHYLEAAEKQVQTLIGIAVDHSLGRIYVLAGKHEKETGNGEIVATKLFVFSTTPSGATLVPPAGGPTTIAMPTGGEFIQKPRGIAVDPTTHEIEVFGINKTTKRAVFQRVTSAGALGKSFIDTEDHLLPGGINQNAEGIAISPITGATYALTYFEEVPGVGSAQALGWEVPSTMTEIKPIPGFNAAARAEGWSNAVVQAPASQITDGPQMAISPDGKTLYFKEEIEAAQEPAGGNYVVRGFSLPEAATTVVYGGTTGCKIETPAAGLGVTGEGAAEKVVVFDFGQLNEAEPEAPKFGGKVLTFGRSSSGNCPAPTAKFKANGSEGNIEVPQGTTVTFDASGSELASGPAHTAGFRKEMIWNFGDGTEEVVKSNGATEATATVTHEYTTSGAHKVTLQIHLKTPTYGNPIAVEHTVTVISVPQLKLKVAKEGSGTIVSEPAGINCGATCEAEFGEGSRVKLTAIPATGFKAATWTGCDAVTGGLCEVTLSAAKEVKASFAVQTFALTLNKGGSGAGTVTSAPTGISCGTTCTGASHEYSFGTVVKLSSASATGSQPVLWTGCDKVVGSNECEVTMSAAKAVTATYALEGEQSLVVTLAGEGTGTVTSSPAGISCGATCSHQFNEGTAVVLSGAPGTHSTAVQWTGCDTVTGSNECDVTMSAAKNVTATFGLITFPLTVTKVGSGTVTSAPTGISCGATCEARFDDGAVVKLAATPEAGAPAVQWSGCDAEPGGECEVTISAAKNVTATFVAPERSFKVSVEGSGEVTSTPAGIECTAAGGAGCEATFAEGAEVKLKAAPAAGAPGVEWKACTGNNVNPAGECVVKIAAGVEAKANFPKATGRLTVTKVGNGYVSSKPAGIGCGGTCTATFPLGTSVTLTGTAAAATEAVIWSGCQSLATGNRCVVEVGAAVAVSARFAPIQTVTPVPPAEPETPVKKKLTKKQKALAHCKTLKGKAKQRCVKKADQIGKPKPKKQNKKKAKKHAAATDKAPKNGGRR